MFFFGMRIVYHEIFFYYHHLYCFVAITVIFQVGDAHHHPLPTDKEGALWGSYWKFGKLAKAAIV